MVKRDPRWRECFWTDCKKIFRPDRPEQVYCSRSCARRADQKAKLPTKEQQVEALMNAIRKELAKILK